MTDIWTLHLKHDCRLLIIDRLLLELGRLRGSPVRMLESADSLSALSDLVFKPLFSAYTVCCLCLVHETAGECVHVCECMRSSGTCERRCLWDRWTKEKISSHYFQFDITVGNQNALKYCLYIDCILVNTRMFFIAFHRRIFVTLLSSRIIIVNSS